MGARSVGHSGDAGGLGWGPERPPVSSFGEEPCAEAGSTESEGSAVAEAVVVLGRLPLSVVGGQLAWREAGRAVHPVPACRCHGEALASAESHGGL